MPFVSDTDEQYIQSIEDPAVREAATCAVTTFRRLDQLFIGDKTPPLDLIALQSGSPHTLLAQGKPLFLIFGSYT